MTANIPSKDFTEEFKKNFTTYAQYVISDRAIPSLEDGFKPVHRRIMYAMIQMGLTHTAQRKKCAKIVGEAMGNYHPHGDVSIYDSLVRLAQPFSTRFPLIDFQGNGGSVDDPGSYAAMRYTEARMANISWAYSEGLNRNAVDFTPNYDNSTTEPVVLPCRIPAPCLLNGSQGIGVGLATSIPPHNLGELIDATLAYLDNRDITISDLCNYIQGPDFPTGGEILGISDARKAYETGRGSVSIRGKVEHSEKDKCLKITELPYQVTGQSIIDSITKLIEMKKITGVGAPVNKTARQGIEIVIPLKKDANVNLIINTLYKNTRLQTSFSMNLVALDNGIPRTLTLKDFITHHIDFRTKTLVRETEFLLDVVNKRLHVLDGLVIALNNLDKVIADIKKSKSSADAKQTLISNYSMSEIQADKVLEMQLRKLAALEQDKIFTEQKEANAEKTRLEGLLADPVKIIALIKEQLLELKEKFNNPRRTTINLSEDKYIDPESLIPNEPTTLMITRMGYVKRISDSLINQQRKGTKGSKGIDILDNDYLVDIFNCMTHDTLLIFTNKAKVYHLKAYEVPDKSKHVKGTNLINLLRLDSDELVSTIIPLNKETTQKYLLLVTKKGMTTRVDKSVYSLKISRGVKAMKLREDDELLAVKPCDEQDIAVFGTDAGYFAKILISEFCPKQSRTVMGVRSMTLKPNNEIVGFDVIGEADNSDLVIITEKGVGKKINISEIQTRHRGSVGSLFIKMKDTLDKVASFCLAKGTSLIVITDNGVINKLSSETLKSLKGRHASGSTLMKLNPGDSISSINNIIEVPTEED